MKTGRMLGILAIAALMLAGCTAGPNALVNTMNAKGVVPGFWQGYWNGLIAPVTFIISLFNPAVQMYEVHNNGNWYNFGFILGIVFVLGGGAGGAAARRKSK